MSGLRTTYIYVDTTKNWDWDFTSDWRKIGSDRYRIEF